MEPDSGSIGSSTVEPVQVTRARTTAALLGAVLMLNVDRLASRADKDGRRPVIMFHYTLGINWIVELPYRTASSLQSYHPASGGLEARGITGAGHHQPLI